MEVRMHAVTPTSAALESTGDDAIETLGLSGATLMQLWSIGVATISDLDSHDSADFKKRLSEALGKSASATSRIEKALAEVREALKGREPLPKKADGPATVIELKPALKKRDMRVEDALTEDERVYAAMPSQPSDPIALLTQNMRRHKLLKFEEQIALTRRVRDEDDQEARNLLVSHNLRLVRKVASRYIWSKLELADLVQEGVIGLMTAIEKFDYTKGFSFSTYATWWIRQAITRAILDKGDLIRIPVHLQEKLTKVRRAMAIIAAREIRPPTVHEIAAATELEPSIVKYLFKVMRMSSVMSIDAPLDTRETGGRFDAEAGWHELLADKSFVSAETIMLAREELDEACERVNCLTEALYNNERISERDREIFVELHGLNGSFKKRTLEHMGDKYDMTRERIRQIIATCWEKLQLNGIDMDYESLFEEYDRIAELEKLAGKTVAVE